MNTLHSAVRRLLTCATCALMLCGTLALAPASMTPMLEPGVAQAASTNSKAKAAYKKKLKKIIEDKVVYDTGASYKFANVYGSGTVEMLCMTRESGGSGRTLRIYRYAGGKVKLMLKTSLYGDNKYGFYRKTGGFYVYCSGHGSEHYEWYKASKGKYKLVASKGRQGIAGGASENGPWSYAGAKGKTITKAAYEEKVKSIKKGAKVKVSASYKWTWMER